MRISRLALIVAFAGLCALGALAVSSSSASAFCAGLSYDNIGAIANDTDADGLNDSVYFYGNLDSSGPDAYINVTLVADTVGWPVDENTTGRFTPNPSLFGGTSFSMRLSVPSFSAADTFTLYTSLDDTNGVCESDPFYGFALYPIGSYAVTVDSNLTDATVEESGSATYTLNVTNLGNNPDNVSFSWYPPPGWVAAASPPSLALGIGESGFANVTITAPHNAPPLYTNQMVVYATSGRNPSVSASITLNTSVAGQRFGVALAAWQGSAGAVPGGTLNLTANVTNLGNNRDNVSFALSAAPAGWSAVLSSSNLFVDAGARQTVTVTVTVPVALTGAITWTPTLTVTAGDTVANASAPLTASILLPDFSVVAGDISVSNTAPTDGDAVTVDVTVRSVATPLALDIVVRLGDGHNNLSKTVAIALTGTGVASFSWTAALGTTQLTVTVDASSAIPEVREDNNVASVAVSVHARNAAPVAAVANATLSGDTGTAITISAAGSTDADGTIAAYNFDFGDGNSSGWVTTSSVAHTYSAAGTYLVKTRVRDNAGAESDNATSTVTITAPAAPAKPSPGFEAALSVAAVGAAAALAVGAAGRRRKTGR